MPSNLRHTQSKVNSYFACDALAGFCATCKCLAMRVRLEEIRGDGNLEEIAAKIGVAISTVQRWEKQTMSIPSLRLPEIAAAYGCKVTDIFGEDPGSETAEIIQLWDRIPVDRRDHAKDVLSTFTKKA